MPLAFTDMLSIGLHSFETSSFTIYDVQNTKCIKTFALMEHHLNSGNSTFLFLVCSFWRRGADLISCISDCSCSRYIAEDQLELLILLPPLSEFWDLTDFLSLPFVAVINMATKLYALVIVMLL